MSAADLPRGHEPARTYANESIEVEWEPRLCIHSQNCVRGLGEVFDRGRRPWVQVDAADADRIAATVKTCPTLFVRGRLRVVDADGNVIREDTRVALCRCGASENKPFCDGSHRRIGFRTEPPKSSA